MKHFLLFRNKPNASKMKIIHYYSVFLTGKHPTEHIQSQRKVAMSPRATRFCFQEHYKKKLLFGHDL